MKCHVPFKERDLIYLMKFSLKDPFTEGRILTMWVHWRHFRVLFQDTLTFYASHYMRLKKALAYLFQTGPERWAVWFGLLVTYRRERGVKKFCDPYFLLPPPLF